MKKLILIASLLIASAAFADEIETLTSSNEVYRATIKTNDIVFFNVIGKSSITRTNLSGWVSLKTNLMNQGYAFSSKTTKVYSAAKPLPDYQEFVRLKYWEEKAKNPTPEPSPTTYVADTTPRKPRQDYESISYTRNGTEYTDSIYRTDDGREYKSRSVWYTDKNGNKRFETYDVP